MRHLQRLTLGLALATLMAASPAPVNLKPGSGPAYDTLGDLAILDAQGRIKPLHTKAVDTVKRIYGRQTIKLPGPDKDTFIKWQPVAAMLDWSARPDFWNGQPFILVEYLPLKRAILAESIRVDLSRVAAKATGEAKTALDTLGKQQVFTSRDLKTASALPGLSEDHRAILLGLSTKLDEDHKWLTPSELEDNEVTLEGGSKPFEVWYRELDLKRRNSDEMGGVSPEDKLSPLEEKAAEVGDRLMTYQAVRDLNKGGRDALDLGIVPRPVGPEYLKATADAITEANKVGGLEGLEPLSLDLAKTWVLYVKDIPGKDRNPPGKSEEFDKKFSAWLAETASWFPLRLLVETDEKDLAKVGFPTAKVHAFRDAYASLLKAESEKPGEVENAKAAALVTAARALGEGRPTYPSAAEMARESYFNKLAPFFHAPEFYGTAVFLLLLTVGFRTLTRKSNIVAKVFYGAGMAMFLGGILLEVYGFYLRVRITGWAPVTNMYETVIWVALVSTIIGLVIELMTRKTYAALAGSGIALIATLLAANVPLLDGNIKTLPPVLRDNFWLSIHVLTIVSSYAAFALAMGLGLLAVGFYLTATYRRSATASQLAMPLLAGLPTLALGGLGVYGSFAGWAPGLLDTTNGYVAAGAVAILGLGITSAGAFSLIGELANRLPAAAGALGATLLATGLGCIGMTFAGGLSEESVTLLSYIGWITGILGCGVLTLALFGMIAKQTLLNASAEAQRRENLALERGQTASVAEHAESTVASAGGSTTATLTRPAETKARLPRVPRADARALSMQETVMLIKPVVNFIYAAMAVGVILVTAGTILGGVWADYSWGRFWGWDPKEVWALITLLVYLIPLHGRFAGWVNTFGLAMLSVVCFSSVLMAWYGVNFVLGVGLHSYGFTEGGGQGIVFACSAAVLGIAGGAWWRRSVSQQVEPISVAV